MRVAQLDRASGYGPEGRGFESCHAHLSVNELSQTCGSFFIIKVVKNIIICYII